MYSVWGNLNGFYYSISYFILRSCIYARNLFIQFIFCCSSFSRRSIYYCYYSSYSWYCFELIFFEFAIYIINFGKNNLSVMLKNTLTKPLIQKLATTTIINNQYNFYVDFKGLLYFDDGTPFLYPNCIKDIKFITNLYNNLKPSTSTNNKAYPYQAQFWGERNHLRYAISPVIFNSINNEGKLRFSIQQTSQFYPDKLELDKEGRVWHPFRDEIKGVFSNQLIAHCLEQVQTKQQGTYFRYQGKTYQIQHVK